MKETARFVSDLNVARFVARLRSEDDPATRTSLRRLLIEEEDKFGRKAERLSNLHRHIAEGRRRIEIQKALITKLKTVGKDARLAESTLSNLLETQRIFEHHRQVIFDVIDRD
jgi:hypothetical protein